MEDNDKERLFLLYHELLNKFGTDKNTSTSDDRHIVWLEEFNTWIDVSPKKRHLVTFIRVGSKDD